MVDTPYWLVIVLLTEPYIERKDRIDLTIDFSNETLQDPYQPGQEKTSMQSHFTTRLLARSFTINCVFFPPSPIFLMPARPYLIHFHLYNGVLVVFLPQVLENI